MFDIHLNQSCLYLDSAILNIAELLFGKENFLHAYTHDKRYEWRMLPLVVLKTFSSLEGKIAFTL